MLTNKWKSLHTFTKSLRQRLGAPGPRWMLRAALPSERPSRGGGPEHTGLLAEVPVVREPPAPTEPVAHDDATALLLLCRISSERDARAKVRLVHRAQRSGRKEKSRCCLPLGWWFHRTNQTRAKVSWETKPCSRDSIECSHLSAAKRLNASPAAS